MLPTKIWNYIFKANYHSNNKELQEKLVEYSYGQQQVAQASHVLVICMENHIDANFIADYFKRVAHIRGTNEAILHPFKASLIADFSKKNKEEIQNWAAKQAYLAMGNLLTVCAVEKIDACPMEGFVPSAYNELLGLEKEGLTSVLVLPVGYRADDDIFSKFKKVRKDIKESIIEIP